MTIPERTLDQRMSALARANEIRCGKARAKRELAARKVTFAAVLGREVCQSATVWELLRATPTIGRVKATKMLNVLRVAPGRRVRSLTVRQRRELVALVAGHERLPSYRRAA